MIIAWPSGNIIRCGTKTRLDSNERRTPAGIKQPPNGSWEVSIYLPGNRRERNRSWRRRYPTEEPAQSAELKLKIARLEGRVKAVVAELSGTEVATSSLKEPAGVYCQQYVLVENRDPADQKQPPQAAHGPARSHFRGGSFPPRRQPVHLGKKAPGRRAHPPSIETCRCSSTC